MFKKLLILCLFTFTFSAEITDINASQRTDGSGIVDIYYRLTDYSDPKIDVLSAEVLNPKYTIVKSLLLATDKKPEVNIEWRVYTKNPDKPLIRDLIIEGLSLARTQKEEFASVIETNNGDVSKLFITLKEFVAK